MTEERNPVVITEEDFNLLRSYIGRLPDKQSEMSLAHELKRATVVSKDAFPAHTVKLNSRVSILDLGTQKISEFMLVLPEKADIKQNKVSILAPMGAALIGFRKGEEVKWSVPAGMKRFRILEVIN